MIRRKLRDIDRSMGSVEDILQSRASSAAGELEAIAKELERCDLIAKVVSSMRTMMTAHGAAELRNNT